MLANIDGGLVCRQLARRYGASFLEARNSHQLYEPILAEGIEIWGVVRMAEVGLADRSRVALSGHALSAARYRFRIARR